MLAKPRKLSKGSKVAIVSPSWGGPATFPHRFEAGKLQFAEAFGVELIDMPNAKKSAEWLHLNPKARADDLMEAFSSPSIEGIVSSIGGDDSIRLLPFLDLGVIKDNPKIFMGYSDTTSLHFACHKAGLSSFYGPSIMAGFGENGGLFDYMKESVAKTLFSSEIIGEIKEADEWTVEHLDWANPENQNKKRNRQKSSGYKLLQGDGIHKGRLIGGCIDVFPMLLGTSIWPDLEVFNQAVLFLETSEEAPPPEEVQRILRNMGVQGILEKLSAILIGRPGGDVKNLSQYDNAIKNTIADEFELKNLPILSQMDFGHTDPMCVLPYGIEAEIDCTKRRVTLLENACKEE